MEILDKFGSEIIALCALFFTAWQFFVQRSHNKVSVRPHLFTFRDRDRFNNEAKITVSLINNGLGPAFISKFDVYLDGLLTGADKAVETVFGKNFDGIQYSTLGEDFAITQGQKVSLLSVRFPIESWADIDAMENHLDRLQLVVEYKSAYSKKMILDTRDG